MALARSWSYSATTTTTQSGETVTVAPPDANSPGFNLNADSISVPTLVTAPPSSASVYAPGSYTANTASVATVVQNTLGYDAVFTGYFTATSASVATIRVGVGATATPTMQTVVVNQSATSGPVWTFSAHVPAGYYYSFQANQANGASVPGSALTIQATPL